MLGLRWSFFQKAPYCLQRMCFWKVWYDSNVMLLVKIDVVKRDSCGDIKHAQGLNTQKQHTWSGGWEAGVGYQKQQLEEVLAFTDAGFWKLSSLWKITAICENAWSLAPFSVLHSWTDVELSEEDDDWDEDVSVEKGSDNFHITRFLAGIQFHGLSHSMDSSEELASSLYGVILMILPLHLYRCHIYCSFLLKYCVFLKSLHASCSATWIFIGKVALQCVKLSCFICENDDSRAGY